MTPPRVWFVTGASSGFGRALSELILKNGEIVVAIARRTYLLDDLVEQYSENRILALKVDVTHRDEVSTAFSAARSAFGRIDVVFNNAGYADLGELESMDDIQARALMETNFWGAVHITREAIKFFRESNPRGEGGRLLQMSSIYGVVGLHCEAFYTASKHALEGLTKCLVQELDPNWNIRITIIEPGYFEGEINSKVKWSPPHPAYSNPALPGTGLRAGWSDFKGPGDSAKAAEVFYRIAALPNPPLHFLVGKDAIAMTRKMLKELEESISQYESWSEGLLRVE